MSVETVVEGKLGMRKMEGNKGCLFFCPVLPESFLRYTYLVTRNPLSQDSLHSSKRTFFHTVATWLHVTGA